MMLAVVLLLLILVPSNCNCAGATRSSSNVHYGLEYHAAFIAGVAPHVQQAASASRWLSQGDRIHSCSTQSNSAPIDCCTRLARIRPEHLNEFSKASGWRFARHNSRCDMGSATTSTHMMSRGGGGDDVAQPPPLPTLERDDAEPSASAWAGGGGSGSGGGGNDDPGVRSLVDLIELIHASENPLWDLIRFEGQEASKQSHVSSMIHGSVLARTSLEDAITCDVANKMATTFLSPTEVSSLMCEMFTDEPLLDFVVAEDLLAHAMQDTSLPDVLTAMLFHKGFAAITTYRLMNWLWRRDRRNMARYLQSICSEVCAADIHPAATIGKGILMAGGCDIVIGETAVVGDSVCILHGVTLGGTGNQTGDRHPKVGKGCHIGAGSSILGNIRIGEGARIEAASVVVKPVAPYTVNRGVPSKTVAFVVCDPHQSAGARVRAGQDAEKDGDGDGETSVDEVGGLQHQEAGAGSTKLPRLFTNYGSLYIGV